MKRLLIVFAVTALIGCNSSKEKQQSDKTPINEISDSEKIDSENFNQTVPYEESVMVLGKAYRAGLKMEAFQDWFGPGYEEYQPNAEVMETLKPLLKDLEITLFMGTWCTDSHRDVPHLYKILDESNFDESKLTAYATSEEKTTLEGYENGNNIIQVPTIIFYKDGKEINRIVEYSFYTLEQDMLNILSGKEYNNPYSE